MTIDDHVIGVNDKVLGHEGNESIVALEQASTREEVQAALTSLREQESRVTSRLDALISSQKQLSRELGKLDLMRGQLGTQAIAARSISTNMLSDAAATAQRLSGAVQRLDLEQAQVKTTLQVVEQVSELKACVLGVTGSMGGPQDWETAAAYLQRASRIPPEIVRGSFAEKQVPSIEAPDLPSVTLDNAAESLCGLFLREFEKAARQDDGPKVTRFFKLFPLIGRSEVGLDVYGRYVCMGVAAHARSNLHAGTGAAQRKDGFFYANALTKLFEYIAQIVERHGGLVERHYGPGSMVRVIEGLQVEADVQGGIVIDSWSDERKIDRHLTDIKSYAFTFLVQNFLPSQTPRPISRAGSPATFERTSMQRDSTDDDNADMKDVDGFLSELSVMLCRWALFCRFLASKCTPTKEHSDPALEMPNLLLESSLMRKVTDKLLGPFNQMMTFYFRRSVEKAFQLDEQPPELSLSLNKTIPSNPPYITSAVDDVMYIVDQVLQRTLVTSQRAVIANVLPTISRILTSDFIGMIHRKMRDESYPKPAVPNGLPPEQTIISFLVLLNDLDVSTDYLRRIIAGKIDTAPSTERSLTGSSASPSSLDSSFPFGNDAAFVRTCLTTLQSSFEAKTSELLHEGIRVLFRMVAKPRLKPAFSDAFRDIDYALSAEQLEERQQILAERDYAVDDPLVAAVAADAVPRRFRGPWDGLMRPLTRILTPANAERLLELMAPYVAEELEKRIWRFYGRINTEGAGRMERDVAAVTTCVVRGARYALRDVFARCAQITLVLNMDDDEWEDVQAGRGEDPVDWKLDAEERARARAMLKI